MTYYEWRRIKRKLDWLNRLRPKRSLMEIMSPQFLADPVAPDELWRISRSEEPSSDEQIYLTFAYNCWRANGGYWTFALADALSPAGYSIIKKCEYTTEFLKIVQDGYLSVDKLPEPIPADRYEDEVDAFLLEVAAMEACPGAYDSAMTEPEPIHSIPDAIPRTLLDYIPPDVLSRYLGGEENVDHKDNSNDRAGRPENPCIVDQICPEFLADPLCPPELRALTRSHGAEFQTQLEEDYQAFCFHMWLRIGQRWTKRLSMYLSLRVFAQDSSETGQERLRQAILSDPWVRRVEVKGEAPRTGTR